MSVRTYLPSAQFTVIVAALAVSGGLVLGAQYITKRPAGTALTTASNVPSQEDWQKTLDDIQASSGISLPEVPDQATVNKLVAGVQSNNLTDSVARSLFIKLTDAKAQGLGDDIPTQDELVAQAAALANQGPVTSYGRANLTTVAQTQDSLRTYGNKVMAAFAAHPKAQAAAVLQAVGSAVDYHDSKYLSSLDASAVDYLSLARNLSRLPVPETLAPLHLQVVNDIAAMGDSIADLKTIVSDPLRGLTGLQKFQAQGNEAARVLTTIAATFNKNGILFSKDEPGASWSAFVSGT